MPEMEWAVSGPSSPLRMEDLANEEVRKRLTPDSLEAFARLVTIWRLTATEASQLLGGVGERTWFRMKAGEWAGPFSQDQLTRLSALFGIFKGLALMFSETLADEWVRLPNRGMPFNGKRPLDLMVTEGVLGMLRVRQHVDALRGGL